MDEVEDADEGPSDLTPEEQEARKKHEKDVSICRQTFAIALLAKAKKLHDARTVDPNLLRPITYCDASWRDSAAAFRQELIELSQRWNELGLPGSCPYQPSKEELTEHAEQYDDFESVQELKLFLKGTVGADSDGWVPTDNWEAVKEEHSELFAQFRESILESGGTEDRARKLWPFAEVDTESE
jgi:hypothetical protein